MSAHINRASCCELTNCSRKAVFDVAHPERGMMAVCEYHAQSIKAAFGDVEVSL